MSIMTVQWQHQSMNKLKKWGMALRLKNECPLKPQKRYENQKECCRYLPWQEDDETNVTVAFAAHDGAELQKLQHKQKTKYATLYSDENILKNKKKLAYRKKNRPTTLFQVELYYSTIVFSCTWCYHSVWMFGLQQPITGRFKDHVCSLAYELADTWNWPIFTQITWVNSCHGTAIDDCTTYIVTVLLLVVM